MTQCMFSAKKNRFSNSCRLQKTLLASAVASVISAPAYSQGDAALEEVVVTGTRQVIQDQINLKRNSTEIVDGMNADEIGELPAPSIGEALETITGAASHRENGGASEISIRGLDHSWVPQW